MSAAVAGPLVSIGLPVYNGERYLAETLESILAQRYPHLDVVISDNASTDATAAICARYVRRDPRLRYSRVARNAGAAANFNRCFALSRGELFTWWMADDLRESDAVQRCVAALMAQPEAPLAYSLARCVGPDGATLHHYETALFHRPWSPDPVEQFVQLGEEFMYSGGATAAIYVAGVMRAAALRRTRLHGAFIASDWTLLAELALLGPWLELPEPLLSIRAHAGSSSLGQDRLRHDRRQQFFDPRTRGSLRVFLSRCRRYAEYWAVVLRSDLGAPRKLRLLAYVTAMNARRARRNLGRWAGRPRYLTGPERAAALPAGLLTPPSASAFDHSRAGSFKGAG
jgi:glycosyltransferase involved in cell wall biosynthesis